MAEQLTVLPSGLVVVEHVPDPPPPPPDPGPVVACQVCGSEEPASLHLPAFGWATPGHWRIHKPVCRHGDWLECLGCATSTEPPMGTPERDAYFARRNCTVCGCEGEYT